MTTAATNIQYQTNRSTIQKYSVELKLIYTASEDCLHRSPEPDTPKQATVAGKRRGGHKGDRNRHLHETKLYCLGCCGVTLAFRTVQWRELVPLSYKRSNSNVPKEAVITISTTILYSITSTHKVVNSHRPQTPNCPSFCMHLHVFKVENKSANPEHSLIWYIAILKFNMIVEMYFLSLYSTVTDDTLTSVC